MTLVAGCVDDSPEDVVILVDSVQLQLKAGHDVVDHDAQRVVEDPGTEAGQMLTPRLKLNQQRV